MKAFKTINTLIPNTVTSLNLLTGCLSIVFAFNNQLIIASALIFVAGIFDFFDGLTARLLKAYSELGKSLDSLADVVSFGIAPSVILFQYLTMAVQKNNPGFLFGEGSFPEHAKVCSAFIIAIFSAYRLAKFNIDTRQTSSFIGVPTPANAFLIASIPFILHSYPAFSGWIINVYVLIPMILVLSFLMVSEIPMISFKFKNVTFADNKSKYILAGSALILFGCFRIAAFPIVFVIYLLLSIIDNPQKI